MSNPETAMRVTGTWLAIGAALLALALIFHGPPSPVMSEQMQIIAEGSARWTIVHWLAAAALSCFAMAGLIALASGSRLTADWTTISAWAVVSVGSLWTMTTAVGEATAITHLAASGNLELFEPWWEFAEGKANGFAFLALAVAVIAANQARNPGGVRPAWAAWIAAVVAVASFSGFAIGMWIGIDFAGLVWVVSSLAMCLWLLWFGVNLAREKAG